MTGLMADPAAGVWGVVVVGASHSQHFSVVVSALSSLSSGLGVVVVVAGVVVTVVVAVVAGVVVSVVVAVVAGVVVTVVVAVVAGVVVSAVVAVVAGVVVPVGGPPVTVVPPVTVMEEKQHSGLHSL